MEKIVNNKINVDWLLGIESGYQLFNSSSLNFEAGIACRLKCGGCMMRNDMKSIGMGWPDRYNIRLDSFKVIFEIFKQFDFCGNLSDPIYHPDFVDTLKYLKGKNIKINFHTNGSGKTKKWWTKVFELCQGEVWTWIFALDGLPEESHKYRINQNGEQVWEMMKLGKSMGAMIDWQWIVFKYNQYHIKEGKLMAAQYGINFKEMHSTRWKNDSPISEGGDKNGTGTGVDMSVYKPTEEHIAIKRDEAHEIDIYSIDINKKNEAYQPRINPWSEIDPDCLNDVRRKPIMFNSMGYFIPCCEKDQWVYALGKRGFYQDKYHIDNLHTADDIRNVFLSDTWQDFYMGLLNNPNDAPQNCKMFCVKNKNIKDSGRGKDPKGFV
jgi:hypothetical protein